MNTPTTAPVLSTPAEHIFDEPTPAALPTTESRLSEEQLYIQYEVKRTIAEIREGRWKRIALQFPDEMLVDAPRVFERLRDGLRMERKEVRRRKDVDGGDAAEGVIEEMEKAKVSEGEDQEIEKDADDTEEKLCILADTSYGACCVDEIAAEHVDAGVVVHYGRACLSPTARLPVIYVFTSPPLDLDVAVNSFKETYQDKHEQVCLVADIPYSHHIPTLHQRLKIEGYDNIFATEVLHDPSSLLPNRTIPPQAREDAEALKEYSIFHISTPPTSLLLILSSRVKRIHIFPTTSPSGTPNPHTPTTLEATTAHLLRRRYALLTRLPSIPIIGILINTLSVSNYSTAITHIQSLIRQAGKKSYLFVVGKVNAAKIANFSEVGAWVVIGCWESSLLESKEFYAPVVTPFELEVALRGDGERVWGGEWVGDFSALLAREKEGESVGGVEAEGGNEGVNGDGGSWEDQASDDEPPDFDLRTGRYVSRTRPMGRAKGAPSYTTPSIGSVNGVSAAEAPPSSALVHRARGDVATINGAVSPGAEFLRSKRTWQGLGSDYEIAYERDGDGKIRGAAIEEGRSGVAKGYRVGEDEVRS